MTETVQLIRVADIRPLDPKLNPRKHAGDTTELRDSVRAKGILQPLLVRMKRKGKQNYEAVIGSRRLSVARELGLETVPATVREGMSDLEARKINLAEQLQREDLTPLDEAGMLAELLEELDGDRREATIALSAELGKPVGYVSRRANLLALHPDILSGKDKAFRAEDWHPAALELLALLPHECQLEEIRFGEAPMLDQLRQRIGEESRRLSLAPWKLDDDELEPKAGACSACPKNSASAPGLFEEAVADAPIEGAVCQDSECWSRKGVAFAKARVAEHEQKQDGSLLLIHGPSVYGKEAQKVGPAIIAPLGFGRKPPKGEPKVEAAHSWQPAKKSEPGAQRALVVSGKGTGSTKWVKKSGAGGGSKSKAKAKKPAASKESPAAPKETPRQERKRLELALEQRRQAWRIGHVRELLENAGVKEVPAALRARTDWTTRAVGVYGFERDFDQYLHGSDGPKRAKAFEGKVEDLERIVWKGVRPRMIQALGKARVEDRGKQDQEAAHLFATVFGGDVAELIVQSEKEIPPQKRLALLVDAKPAPAKKKVAKKATRKAPAKRKATRKKTGRKATTRRKTKR